MNKIKKMLLGSLLMLLTVGCAPNDLEFNIEALTFRHQRIFYAAINMLNEQKDEVHFSISVNGVSWADYGTTPLNTYAYTYDLEGRSHIVFLPRVSIWAEDKILSLTLHELCHTLWIGHYEGNPVYSNCLSDYL